MGIRQLIEESEVAKAHEKLNEFFSFIDEVKNELAIQTGRINRINKEGHMAVVSLQDADLEKNKISLATLYCCSEIENKLKDYFPTIKFTLTSEPLDKQVELKLMGKYDKLNEIYNGEHAVFYRFKEVVTDRKVIIRAFKHMDGMDGSNDLISYKRLKSSLNIKHRNIVNILGADLNDHPKYLILEHINGVSLDHLIGNVPFTRRRSLAIIRELCEAIYYLHINGITHGKLKPDKVLIDSELRPVISFFDIVSKRSSGRSDQVTAKNLLYSAPEYIKGDTIAPDYKSDQFLIGVLAYELLAGEPIFYNGRTSPNLNLQKVFEQRIAFFSDKKFRQNKFARLGTSREVISILSRMLSEDPDDRYGSLQDVISALDKVKISGPAHAEIAHASYERCCIANRNFTTDFYELLFERSEPIRDMFHTMGSARNLKLDKMLMVAIELLIHHREEEDKLLQVLQSKAHEHVDDTLYELFIDTIIECISRNDFILQDNVDKGVKDPVEKAWQQIRKESMKLIQEKSAVAEN